jgi:hypothetical protein
VNPTTTEPQLPAELQPLEISLAALAPRRDRLDYDLILFRAGQLVERSKHPVATVNLTGVNGTVVTILVQPETRNGDYDGAFSVNP